MPVLWWPSLALLAWTCCTCNAIAGLPCQRGVVSSHLLVGSVLLGDWHIARTEDRLPEARPGSPGACADPDSSGLLQVPGGRGRPPGTGAAAPAAASHAAAAPAGAAPAAAPASGRWAAAWRRLRANGRAAAWLLGLVWRRLWAAVAGAPGRPSLLQAAEGPGPERRGAGLDSFTLLSLVVAVALLTGLLGASLLREALAAEAACAPAPAPTPAAAAAARAAAAEEAAARRRPRLWARPAPGVKEDVMPALCPLLLSQGKYHPLFVPLEPLRSLKACRVQVLAGYSRLPLLAASFSLAAGTKPTTITISDINERDRAIASIDSSLQIKNEYGAPFARLEKTQGQFWLREPCRTIPRWTITASDEASITVVWHRSRNKLLSRLIGGVDGQVVATASKLVTEKDGDFIEVRGVDGCDLVLALLCSLGLIWLVFFRGDKDAQAPGSVSKLPGDGFREAEKPVKDSRFQMAGATGASMAAGGKDTRYAG